jgi:hypothetical protein
MVKTVLRLRQHDQWTREVVQMTILKGPRTESEIQSVADVFMRSHFKVFYKVVGNKSWKVLKCNSV